MQIITRPLTSLSPAAVNPRTHPAAQLALLAASIREFGFTNPLLIDPDGGIIAGHGRLAAAEQVGMTEVPCIVLDHLTVTQRRALVIADNQIALGAGWDEGLLASELKELRVEDYDLALLGFDEHALETLISGLEGGEPDEVPAAPALGEAITRPGDLWLLGHHRLLCSDSTAPETMSRLMDGAQADLLLTDPPYNVGYEGRTEDRLTIANDDLGDDAYRRLLVAALGNAVGVLKPGGGYYIWHADSEGLAVRSACAAIGLTVRQCLIWTKNTFVLGRQDYQWQHEPCLYGWANGAAHTWLSDRSQTTVLAYDKPSRSAEHPTMKPVELIAYQITNSCPTGGIVLDPFGGSGTTMIAAQQTGRRGYLVELDPRYADVIVRRYAAYAATDPVRVAPDGTQTPWSALEGATAPSKATEATGLAVALPDLEWRL